MKNKKLSILQVSREYHSLAEAGGVKDVVQEITSTLKKIGYSPRVFLPLYGFIQDEKKVCLKPWGQSFFIPGIEGSLCFWNAVFDGVDFIFLDHKVFTEKKGVYTYTEEEAATQGEVKGTGYRDAPVMNLLFQCALLEYLKQEELVYDIVHLHDGHAALVPFLAFNGKFHLREENIPAFLITLHNAALPYRQVFFGSDLICQIAGIPEDLLEPGRVKDYYDPFLLSGSYCQINTVSPWYARELMQGKHREFARGFGPALKKRGIKLQGILNGINPMKLDPRHPVSTGITYSFDPLRDDEGKRLNKNFFLTKIMENSWHSTIVQYGKIKENQEDLPLVSLQSRFTHQKGIDIALGALKELFKQRSNFLCIIMGQGQPGFEKACIEFSQKTDLHYGHFIYLKGYDMYSMRQLLAASDFFLIPSRYEPCGLTDYMSQMLGALPIGNKVGGLRKISSGRTGFLYSPNTAESLAAILGKAIDLYKRKPRKIKKMKKKSFQTILKKNTWEHQLKKGYLPLYRKAINGNKSSNLR